MSRASWRAALTVVVSACATVGFGAEPALAETPATPTLVVASVPDPASATPDGNVVQTFNLASTGSAATGTAAVGPYPWGLAITPDGSTAYVASTDSGTVTPVNVGSTSSQTALCLPYGNCSSPDPATEPEGLAIAPDGSSAWVVNSGENSLSQISLGETGPRVVGPPITGSGLSAPDAIALTPDGSTAWVANYGSGSVVPVDLATGHVGSPVQVGAGPTWLSITPNGQQLLVANSQSSSVTIVDLGASPVTTTTVSVDKGAAKPSVPDAVAVSPNGGFAYVADAANDLLVPINLRSAVAGTGGSVCPSGHYCGADPAAIAISPDGTTAYVGDMGTDSVSVLQLPAASSPAAVPAPPTFSTRLATDGSPDALAVTPGQSSVASFTATAAGVGDPTTFDASASSPAAAAGSLTFSWNFGDGSSQTTTNPQTSHVYTAAGSYTVTLTVSNGSGTANTVVYTGQTVSRNGSGPATQSQVIHIAATVPTTEAIIAGADGSATPAGFTEGNPPGAAIGEPATVGSSPAAVAIAPDARTAYVVDSGADELSQVDIATGQAYAAARWIGVGSEPDAIAITPDGRSAYVVNGGSTTVTQVTLRSGGTTTIQVPAAGGAHLDGIAIPSDGVDAFVTDAANNTVTPITLATGAVGRAVGGSGLSDPDAIATAPAGQWAYVVDGGTPTHQGGLTAVKLANGTPQPEQTIALDAAGDHPDAIAIAPDGKTAYVVDAPTNGDLPSVVAITLNGATMSAGTPIQVPSASTLNAISLRPSGNAALAAGASSGAGVLVPLALGPKATVTLGSPVSLSAAATGLAIAPDQAPDAHLAVSRVRLAAGGRVTANAAGSSSAPAALATLSFSFGDGSALVSAPPATPTATHTYRQAGRFRLTVTAADSDGTASAPIGTGQTLLLAGNPNASATQTITVYPTVRRLQQARTATGIRLNVFGTGFAMKRGATVIRFGSVRAGTVSCRSHTHCVATLRHPPRLGRAVAIRVIVGGQESPQTSHDRFSYRDAGSVA
jgi:DNA-binding beta-propeller fold protein YncE